MAAGSRRSPPMLGTMAKMAPRPVPEMFATFATFAKFANFNPALELLTLTHRQARRSRSMSDRACSMQHSPSPCAQGEGLLVLR